MIWSQKLKENIGCWVSMYRLMVLPLSISAQLNLPILLLHTLFYHRPEGSRSTRLFKGTFGAFRLLLSKEKTSYKGN